MAGPMELAFLPKALWLLQSEAVPQRAPRPDDSTMEDLRRLQSAADWAFVEELFTRSRLLWLGREVPGWMRRRLDPFAALPILSLQNRVLP